MFSLLEKNVIFKEEEGSKDDIDDTDHGQKADDNDHGEEDDGPDDTGRLRTLQAIVDCCKLSSCKLQAVLDPNFASLSLARNKHLKTQFGVGDNRRGLAKNNSHFFLFENSTCS